MTDRRLPPQSGPLLATLLLCTSVAWAAPLTAPRRVAEARPLAPLSMEGSIAEADALTHGRCGTIIDRLPELLGELAARPLPAPLRTTYTGDVGEIAVLEDDGTFFYTNTNNQPLVDLAAVTRAFYRDHPDSYDAVALYLASGLNHWLGSPGALAAAWQVRNDVDGIGLHRFDYGPALGTPPGLSMILTMNGLHRYPSDLDAPIGGDGDTYSTMDVLAHEFAHRWLAYTYVDSAGSPSPALLGRDRQHWNFFADVDGSFMEGCEWTEVAPDSFRTTAVSERFGVLDQYLMGLRTRSEIDSFFVVNAPTQFDPPGTYIPFTTPFVGLGCNARATTWRVGDIEAIYGPRVPDGAVSPRNFRVALVLITPRGTAPTPSDLAKLESIRQRFPLTMSSSTDGRASVDCTLDALPELVGFAHKPLRDTETELGPRPLTVSTSIRRGLPSASVSRVELAWRTGTSGPFTVIPLAMAAADSFVGLVPAAASGDAQYYLTAFDDPAGVSSWLPPLGPAAPFTYHVGPDLTPPTIRHTPVEAQSRDRLPQTLLARVGDALGVDSVWCEYRVGTGGLQSLGAARLGRDSFTVALGSGASIGTKIAYRFRARDRALAANLAVSNAGFDTLRVVRDWIDDFENPTTFFHTNVLYSWRDAWHVEQGASAQGGEFAWHCGNGDGSPYAAHLDAALYSPLIPTLGPRVMLSFDHRYDFEADDGDFTWDAARVEVSMNNGPWQAATPQAGYTHVMGAWGMPFPRNSPCWGGSSLAWSTETIDLSSFGPGPARIRFRMSTDDFVGGGGWWVDRLRIHYPDNPSVDVPLGTDAFALGAAWPNPARGQLHQALRLPRAGNVEWTLHDLLGRRVQVLTAGRLEAGAHELVAELPRGRAHGVYFARLQVNGQPVASQCIAVLD